MSAVPARPAAPPLVEFTIDGKRVVVPAGTLLVEAAKTVGIEIPVFCHHEKLKPVGACRMCLVEIEKMPRLQTACTTPVAPNMVVKTTTPGVKEGREGVIEMLLANHPLDCPICDKGGECPLQDNTFKYGGAGSRLDVPKKANDKALPLSDRIVLDRERCILCYRCTRFQEEIAGDGALVALERGGTSEIGTLPGETFDSPFSGNTVEICPVGALTSRHYRFRSRPWDLVHSPSVCSGCSVGCNVMVDSRDGSVLRVTGRTNDTIDDGWLCDRGRYDSLPLPVGPEHDAKDGRHRVRVPLLRIDGRLQRVPFARAAARAMELLRGSRAAVLLSAKLSNEAIRIAAGDFARALPSAAIGFAEPVVSPMPVAGRIANLASCTKIVDLGCDPWNELPVLALWVRKAVTKGATLVAIGPKNGLFRDTTDWLRTDANGFVAACEALLAALGGESSNTAATAMAANLRAAGPAAVLVGAELAKDERVRTAAQKIAAALGADGETGFVGAPMRATNARGAADLAPKLAATDPLAERPDVVFSFGSVSFGSDAPVLAAGGRSIVATSGAVPDDPSIEVVLPLAHPYETDGHVTNLEGTEQRLQGAPRRAGEIRMDHELLAALLAVAATPAAAATGGSR